MEESILLINPNNALPLVAPISLDYLASDLINRGYTHVQVLDLNNYDDEPDAILKTLGHVSPKLIGITIRNICNQFMPMSEFFLERVKKLVKLLREHTDATIVLGGVGFSSAPNACLNYIAADYGVVGSGIGIFSEYTEKFIKKEQIEHSSIVSRGQLPRQYRPHSPVGDEYFDFKPQRTLINNEFYYKEGGCIGVETKYGCPEKCIYCVEPLAKCEKMVFRDANLVIKEIRQLRGMGVESIHFCDSEFNIPAWHAEKICSALIDNSLHQEIKWYGYCHPSQKYFSYELLKIFSQSGCAGLCLGVDSMDESLLQKLNRTYGPEDVKRFSDICSELKLPLKIDLMVGVPGETIETLQESIRRIASLKPDRASINLGVRIYPNTELANTFSDHKMIAKESGFVGEWSNDYPFLFPCWYVSPKLGTDPMRHIREISDRYGFFIIPDFDASEVDVFGNNAPVKLLSNEKKGVFWALGLDVEEGSSY